MPVDANWMVGAILGSGLYVFFGRQPARRLLAHIRQRIVR
jgi:hypothetical protein